MNLPNAPTIITALLVLVVVALPVHGADDCDDWERTIATYEDEVHQAIRDEPEDLPKELRRHSKAVQNGYADQAERIDTKIREGLTALQAIEPHPDMTRFHADSVDLYRNGVAVLDAERDGDGPGRDAAEIRTWQSLRRLLVTVRDLLSTRGCYPGDVEAIDRDYLGAIDAEIDALQRRTGRQVNAK